MSSLDIITTGKKLTELLESKTLVLMASTTTCPPCRAFTPIMEEVSSLPKFSKIKFAKINMDEHPSANDIIGITSVPTILFFKEGGEVHREVGAMPRDKLISLIETLLL